MPAEHPAAQGQEFCGNEQPHERHEWIDGMLRRDCPGGRDWTAEPYTKDELLVANVQMVRRLSLGDIEDGADPVAALNKALDFIVGFIEGRHGMIVPPHMIPPAELEEAVAWGRELAEEHGW